MAQAIDTTTPHLLTGGEVLLHRFARDSHGSTAQYWTHMKDGKSLRFIAANGNAEDSAYLQLLKEREVSITVDIISERGYVATLPDGRRINPIMISAAPNDPGLVKHELNYPLFKTREDAVRLLINAPVVVDYHPEAPQARQASKARP